MYSCHTHVSIEVMLKEKGCMQGRLRYVSGHYAKYDPHKQNTKEKGTHRTRRNTHYT